MKSGSQQLALALFQDLAPREVSVAEAPHDLGFKRSNAFVQIVDLSLAARRLIDVSYFFVADDTETRNEYRIDFGLFRWLMNTTSNNRKHLTKIIREAQKAALEIDSEDAKGPWGAVPLMGPAFVQNSEFIFELPERLQRAIKNPTAFHFLSLRYVFKSIHSKVLFDRLQPFMADGITPWHEVGAMRAWMDCETKTYDLFKHFRNKVLEVAIAEIREVTGIQVDMLTQNEKGSKRIAQLRFRMQGRQQQDDQKTAFIVLRSMYETLRKEFALNQEEFNEIITNRQTYTDERINQAIEYTRHAAARNVITKRAGGYFMKALREGYLLGEMDKQIHQKRLASEQVQSATREADAREALLSTASDDKKQKEVELGWEHYGTLPEDEQAELVAQFTRSQSAKVIARVINVELQNLFEHVADPKVHSTFGSFVASKVLKAVKAARTARVTGKVSVAEEA
jgi:hypothetical protein